MRNLVNASLIDSEGVETLRLAFSSHDVEITGHNLRSLFLALQEFAVKMGALNAGALSHPGSRG